MMFRSAAFFSLLAFAPSLALAGEVARFDFNVNGQPEGWTTIAASRLVADGVLSGQAMSADPQLRHDGVECAPRARWDTLSIQVRELDHHGEAVPYAETGVVLIFNASEGPGATNFGPPRLAGEPDEEGFVTLTWDLSSFEGQSSGRIRLDPIGGPETVRPGAKNNRFEVNEIVITDTGEPGPG